MRIGSKAVFAGTMGCGPFPRVTDEGIDGTDVEEGAALALATVAIGVGADRAVFAEEVIVTTGSPASAAPTLVGMREAEPCNVEVTDD